MRGRTFEVLPGHEIEKKRGKKELQNKFPSAVLSPLPGKIIGVKVAPGDSVSGGDILFVLESMKMEHAVRSPASGKVENVCVRAGAIVDASSPLAHLIPVGPKL